MIGEVVDARAVRMDDAAAWELLRKAAKITVAKGKTVLRLTPQQEGKEEILKQKNYGDIILNQGTHQTT